MKNCKNHLRINLLNDMTARHFLMSSSLFSSLETQSGMKRREVLKITVQELLNDVENQSTCIYSGNVLRSKV